MSPRACGCCRKQALGGAASDPAGQRPSHTDSASPPARALGVGEMPFFEETDSIFYREQAVFLFLYRFSDVIFTFAPIPFAGLGRGQHRSGHPPGRARPGHAHAARGEAQGQGREAGPAGPGLGSHGDQVGAPVGRGPGDTRTHQRGLRWPPQRGGVGLSCPAGPGEPPGAGSAVPVAGGACPGCGPGGGGGACRARGLRAPAGWCWSPF